MDYALRQIIGDNTVRHRAALAGDALIFAMGDYLLCDSWNEFEYNQPFSVISTIYQPNTYATYNILFSTQLGEAFKGTGKYQRGILGACGSPVISTIRHENTSEHGSDAMTVLFFDEPAESGYGTYLMSYNGSGIAIGTKGFNNGRSNQSIIFDTLNSKTIINGEGKLAIAQATVDGTPLGDGLTFEEWGLTGKIKTFEIVNFAITASQARHAYNEGTFENVAANANFLIKVDTGNANLTTSKVPDDSPNAHNIDIIGSPTKSTFLP